MAKAYVLINVDVGKAASVVNQLRSIAGISGADVVAGPYDIVATIQAEDSNAIGRLIMNQVHGLDGLKSTLTLMVMVVA
ncbi:MAG: Lrp/AsnC ligand binding domain-containing protein [Chloroflexi bacterium]|nr:Lrp/AsnC ligand binding domain-containing protein [Chloroflexota bacterium]MCL5076377.1 Lrp/AsnC ligand binding domain-containing protein [Chloroflexota bacterium]